MNNKDLYRDIMSDVLPSEHTVERIMDMANTDSRKKTFIKPVLAVAVCAAVLAAGIFAGGGFGTKKNTPVEKTDTANSAVNVPIISNFFVLKAYAEEGGEVQIIKESGRYTMQSSKLEAYYDDDGAYIVEMSGKSDFEVSGENIKTVRYQCENGSFGFCMDLNKVEYLKKQNKYYDAVVPYSEDLKQVNSLDISEAVFENYENGKYDKYFREKKPVSDYLKAEKIYDGEKITGVGFVSVKTYQSVASENNCRDFTYTNCAGTAEFLNNASWRPDMSKLFDVNGNPSGIGFDELEHDKLTVTVEFNDGSVQTQSYDLGFNENGNLEIQKVL